MYMSVELNKTEYLKETQYFEDTLITATVIAVVLIIIITVVIVVCILCKTPPKTTREGRRSNSLKKRVIESNESIYWSVQDSNAPQGIIRDRPQKAPMEMQGSIYNEETAREKVDEDMCDYYNKSNQG